MKRMTYMSNFSRPLSHDEIHSIGTHARTRNAHDDITGVLLTLGSVFFQIIEGEAGPIDDLYTRVLADDRHTDVICLRAETDVDDRLFPDWSMNIVDLDQLGGDAVGPLKLLLGRMSEAQTIIERYTQPAVSRIMTEGRNPLDVPLRKVSRLVLFTDMVAYSAISDRLPIEDVAELVGTYLETCSVAIDRRGGEVTKFLGDGVMAYFDVEHVDAALHACVDIRRELALIRTSATEHSALRLLYSGFGLSLGPVIEGNMGSSIKMDYTIIGEPVNTAAKLEALTRSVDRPVLMTSDVVDATKERWDFDQVGVFDLGRDEPMTVHALRTGVADASGMREAVARGLDTVSGGLR